MAAKMVFDDLIKKVGFGLAVVICQKKLPDYFFNSLFFGQLLEVYKETYPDTPLQKKLLEKIAKKNEPFEVWLKTHGDTRPGDPLEKMALEEMVEKAYHTEQMWAVCKRIFPNSPLKKTDLKKMVQRIKSFKGLWELYEKLPSHNPLKKYFWEKWLNILHAHVYAHNHITTKRRTLHVLSYNKNCYSMLISFRYCRMRYSSRKAKCYRYKQIGR